MKKIILMSIIVLVIPVFTNAQTTTPKVVSGNDKYTLLEPLPCIDGVGNCTPGKTQTEISLNDYVGYVYKFAIALAAFLAIVMIIWGGFEYMTVESVTGKSDARSKITNAATGLLMVLASYLILRTIDPRLVQINTSLPAIKVDLSTTKDFLTPISTDLNRLSLQSQSEVKAMVDNITTLEDKRRDLETKFDSGDINSEQYELELNQIDQDIEKNKSNIAQKTLAEGSYSKYVSLSQIMRNTDPSDYKMMTGLGTVTDYIVNWIIDPKKTALENLEDASVAEINKAYEAQKATLSPSNTQGLSGLSIARDFYVDNIKDEVFLITKIDTYKGCTVSCATQKTYLQNILKDYQNDYNASTPTQIVDGKTYQVNVELNNQYKLVLMSRIEYLQNVLNQKK